MRNSLALPALALAAAVMAGNAAAIDLTVESTAPQPVIVEANLTTSKGKRLRFPDDLLAKGGTVLLSFTLTGCIRQCPPSDALMDGVAELAAADGRADLTLATLTLNPVDDTPEQLDAGRAQSLSPARIFLTGHPAEVFAVLEGFGLRGGPSEDHAVRFILLKGREVQARDTLSGPESLYAWARSGD